MSLSQHNIKSPNGHNSPAVNPSTYDMHIWFGGAEPIFRSNCLLSSKTLLRLNALLRVKGIKKSWRKKLRFKCKNKYNCTIIPIPETSIPNLSATNSIFTLENLPFVICKIIFWLKNYFQIQKFFFFNLKLFTTILKEIY